MNILAVGDVVGQVGVRELKKRLPKIKEKYNIDFCIVNGENAADGMGLTEKLFNDILQAVSDIISMKGSNQDVYYSA